MKHVMWAVIACWVLSMAWVLVCVMREMYLAKRNCRQPNRKAHRLARFLGISKQLRKV